MIQRIQTILLFLAAALCVAFLFLPTWQVNIVDVVDGNDKAMTAYPMQVHVHASTMGLEQTWTDEYLPFTSNTFLLLQFIFSILTAGLLLVTIFLYGNRPLQIKLVYGAVLMLMSMNILMIPIRSWLEGMHVVAEIAKDHFQSIPQWGLAAPFLALILAWFSIKRIQHDEKLVKGMDRIR